MSAIEYQELPEFRDEFNKLQKRFKTLSEDLEIAKKAAIELFHVKLINNHSTFQIPGLKSTLPIFKLKKFACKSIKGKGIKSGIRIIYAWDQSQMKIFFIEIYYKGDKENEDKARLKEYIKFIDVDL